MDFIEILKIAAQILYLIIGIPLIIGFWKALQDFARHENDDIGAAVAVLLGIALPILYVYTIYSLYTKLIA